MFKWKSTASDVVNNHKWTERKYIYIYDHNNLDFLMLVVDDDAENADTGQNVAKNYAEVELW